MSPAVPVVPLRELVTLRITGSDARRFLQGQLSCDLARLTPQRALLASCNSARGKVQAILTVLERENGIVALVPASLVRRTIARLRAYILRSAVTIEGEMPEGRPDWVVAPLSALEATSLTPSLPQAPGQTFHLGSCTVLRWWSADERYLLVAPPGTVAVEDSNLRDAAWRRANIAAGLAQVYPQTHESFIAQMLNLDLLGGISFDKGCYTGQEIIARMHYRSTVKRRTFRFSATCAAPVPGTRVMAGGEQIGEVVDAATTAQGCEFLAVISLVRHPEPLSLEGLPDAPLQPLGLPYAIPEVDQATLEWAS
jgi:folate-binding protein YgfZ